MTESQGYVDSQYLQRAANELRSIKEKSYAYLNIGPGSKVLDVGCGPGTDTIPLAYIVGGNGQIIGIDTDKEMIAEANRKSEELRINLSLLHQIADAEEIPFEDGYFDASRSERVFQHLSHPHKALKEMIRVTKPTGKVIVIDTDWATFSIDSTETVIERKLAQYTGRELLHNGYSGRKLLRLFKKASLSNIFVELFPTYLTSYEIARKSFRLDKIEEEAIKAKIINENELLRWRQNLKEADEGGYFFASLSLTLVVGERPK